MMPQHKRSWTGAAMRMASVAAALAAALAPAGRPAASAAGAPVDGDGIGTAQFSTEGGITNFSAAADTIPYFRSAFTDPTNGVTYPFTMVGTDPAAADVATTIPTVIIPLSFTFAASADPNVHTLDGTARVAATVNSPIFQAADIGAAANASASAPPAGVAPANARPVNEPSDVTQLGDAIYRAQWGKTGTGYHVRLGAPIVLPTVAFAVPQNQGFIVVGSRSHARIGLLDYQWFSNRLMETLRSRHLSAQVLPIFLVNNTFLYINSPANCCVLGYHGATLSLNGNGR